ncbi:IMP cyclohydrolase [Lacticaseibacillus rhamnosus]|uniref:IMP cyclohydrolase n=1 Tax=Lacticaseibacillus rhamnosus TaxID=47715 RepID=A0AAP8J320_LACRH|nr:IMP cyclohydrolase [Lacticaseibacillus rhamnosus]QEW10942.1 IMP cyclohydrolase [Lacticaseibacillus rhamnosus]QPB47455.1 IMP cyclohydrolase [Lacticaseibacillus rhamnosus]TXK02911.1 IMP cyclohydrolase [Lacticaseibacillus rhamnosus]
MAKARPFRLEATYTPTPNRAGSRSLSLTRSPAQKSACKDLSRNGQNRAITAEATYTPTSNRAGPRSLFRRDLFATTACFSHASSKSR